MHDAALVIALIGIIIFVAHLFEALFRQTRIPDVLPLVIIGLILGPLLNIATPTHFGAVGPIFTTVTFIFILFEAGTGLRLAALRSAYKETLLLSVISFALTVIAVGAASLFLTDLGIMRSLLLGVITGSVSSAVVAPMIQQLKLKMESRVVLLLDSTLADVFSVIAAISLLEVIKLGDIIQFDFGLTIGKVIASFALAAALGVLSAGVWAFILNKVRSVENYMFTTVAFVFVIFGFTEWLGYSGPVAALAFGITMGNIGSLNLPRLKTHIFVQPSELNREEKAFLSELVFIFKTLFFVYMGISLQIADWHLLLISLIITLIIYLVRLPVVKFTADRSTPVFDATIMAVVIPRGLTAAVLASIPFQQGVSGGEIIQNIAYAIILISIIFTSLLIFLIDKTGISKFYGWLFSNFSRSDSSGQ